MTAMGFEPTPLRNGALSHRLRPLGQTVLNGIQFVSAQCRGTATHVATESRDAETALASARQDGDDAPGRRARTSPRTSASPRKENAGAGGSRWALTDFC